MSYQSAQFVKDSLVLVDTIKHQIIESATFNEVVQKGDKIDLQWIPIIIAILGALTSIYAVIISRQSLKSSKDHNTISVEPLLVFRPSTSHKSGKLSVSIFNKGIGPLIFTNFEMIYEGKSYKHCSDVFKTICAKFGYTDDNFDNKYRLFSLQLIDYPLTINEKKTLIKYQLLKSEKENRAFYKEIKEIEFKYSYKDLYDNETPIKSIKLKDYF